LNAVLLLAEAECVGGIAPWFPPVRRAIFVQVRVRECRSRSPGTFKSKALRAGIQSASIEPGFVACETRYFEGISPHSAPGEIGAMTIRVGALIARMDERSDLFSDGLSRSAMLKVTGLSVARLMSWYKRKTLPTEYLSAPGRGIRRRFYRRHIYFLLLTRLLADAGLPLEDAGNIAIGCLRTIEASFLDLTDLTVEQAAVKLRDETQLLIFLRPPEGMRPENWDELPSSLFQMATAHGTLTGIAEWMREHGAHYAIALDIAAEVAGMLERLQNVFSRAT
jgi:DNA-binding transcriptional MerR regulator